MDKEKITELAEALYNFKEAQGISEIAATIESWLLADVPTPTMIYDTRYSEIPLNKPEPPKELMDCILSEDEINEAWKSNIFVSDPYKDIVSHVNNVLEAQLQSSKLKAYIDSQVQGGGE